MSKRLVAYFSASGVTAKVAENLADAIGADVFEIQPEVPYTKDDLNWMDKKSRSTIEMSDPTSRPAIAVKRDNMDEYDTIFVGFPIWWYVAPTIINTFLESYNLKGKTIIEGIQQGEFLFQCLKNLIFNITDLKDFGCTLSLSHKFQSFSAPECWNSLFEIVCHHSPAISAADFSFQREVHAAHQHFMAVAFYDKLRFFKFFPADDCFMGSRCNKLLSFGDCSDNAFARNQRFGFTQNHRPCVHIRCEDFPNAGAVPKYYRGNGIGRFLAIRLILFVIYAWHRNIFVIEHQAIQQ